MSRFYYYYYYSIFTLYILACFFSLSSKSYFIRQELNEAYKMKFIRTGCVGFYIIKNYFQGI